MSPAQSRAFDDVGPHALLAYTPNTALDYRAIFGREAPTILEIGFGMGESTAAIAALRPDDNFIGIEVHSPGVGALLKLIGEQQLSNLKIIQHDAVDVLNTMVPNASLAGLHIFFPDPWPKKRHHKRRLIQAPFVQLLTQKLIPDGYLHLATDWQEYAEQMLLVLGEEPQLANTATDYASRPSYRGTSGFERKGLTKGHGIWDLVFRRR